MEDRSLNSEIVYRGKVFDVLRDEISLPGGKTAFREYVKRGNAAAVIARDADGKILFVRQYRHAARDLMLEIPAGMLEPGEDPALAAARELEEETGFKNAEPLRFLTQIIVSVGICTEKIYIYIAESLVPGRQNLDEDEFVTVEKYTLDDALNKVYSGEIYDSKTAAALFMYKDWSGREKKPSAQ